VDARGAPQRIGAGHVGEESGDRRIEWGPTRAVASRAPSPPPTEPGAMPSETMVSGWTRTSADRHRCQTLAKTNGRSRVRR
jgi:hypothetical protein